MTVQQLNQLRILIGVVIFSQIGQVNVAPKPIVAVEKVANFLHKTTFACVLHPVNIYERDGIFAVSQSVYTLIKFDFSANIRSAASFDARKMPPNFACINHRPRQKFHLLILTFFT